MIRLRANYLRSPYLGKAGSDTAGLHCRLCIYQLVDARFTRLPFGKLALLAFYNYNLNCIREILNEMIKPHEKKGFVPPPLRVRTINFTLEFLNKMVWFFKKISLIKLTLEFFCKMLGLNFKRIKLTINVRFP